MAFNVNLGINQSPDNALDKDITQVLTINGVLRETSSIINPTILIECNIITIARCNYAIITEFGRK